VIENFRLGEIFRGDSMTQKFADAFSVFAIIGSQYAERVAKANNPREVKMLERISLAFHEVESRVSESQTVSSTHVDALAESLCEWFTYIGESQSKSAIQSQIEQYDNE
jgi:hypothetical protein